MKIAVLLSAYNGEDYIRTQINSILNQEGDFRVELWVRDDGSEDSTKSILKEYADAGKLYWYMGDNLGAAYSFFDLVKHCKGYDYYAFADQDDYWMPDKLNYGISGLNAINVPALYFSNARVVDEKLRFLGRNVYRYIPKTDFETLSCSGGLLGCTMIFNKQLAAIIQKKEMPNAVVMHDFYIALLCKAFGGEIVYDNNAHIDYRQHKSNCVGVAHGTSKELIGAKIRALTKKQIPGIDKQAASLLSMYIEDLPEEYGQWLKKVSVYNTSFIKRISLSLSTKTRYDSIKKGALLRISILLGNR